MVTTIEQLREALPGSLRTHVASSQLALVLVAGFLDIDPVNGCTLRDIQAASEGLKNLGIVAVPCYEAGSERLLSVSLLKR